MSVFDEFSDAVSGLILGKERQIDNLTEKRNEAIASSVEALTRVKLKTAYVEFRRAQDIHARLVRLKTELAEQQIRRKKHKGSTLVVVYGEDDMEDFNNLQLGVDYEFLEVHSEPPLLESIPPLNKVIESSHVKNINITAVQQVYNFVNQVNHYDSHDCERDVVHICRNGRKILDQLTSESVTKAEIRKLEEDLSKISADIAYLRLDTVRDVKQQDPQIKTVHPVHLRTFEKDQLTVIDKEAVYKGKNFEIRRGTYQGKSVLLKKKVTSLAFDHFEEDNFTREALILQILNARKISGVVESFGVDDAESPCELLMESGTSLAHFLAESPHIGLVHKITILAKCCSIFATLVDAKILHRDIKPENIMIMPNSVVKIMNFGFVRSEETGLSSGVTLRGTHSYVAPELLMSTSGSYQYSEATDMYSFAIMMNCVLTGVAPFEKYTHTQLIGLMYKSQGKHRPDIITESALPGNEVVCQGLVAIIAMCWNVFVKLRLPFKLVAEQLKALIPQVVEEGQLLVQEYGRNMKQSK